MTTTPRVDFEELLRDMREHLAMLIRWSEAESYADRGGTTIEVEHEAWRGMLATLREIRAGVVRVERSIVEGDRR